MNLPTATVQSTIFLIFVTFAFEKAVTDGSTLNFTVFCVHTENGAFQFLIWIRKSLDRVFS